MKVGQWGQRRKQEPLILSKLILKIKVNLKIKANKMKKSSQWLPYLWLLSWRPCHPMHILHPLNTWSALLLLGLHHYKCVLPFPFLHQQVTSSPVRAEIMYCTCCTGHVLLVGAHWLWFQVTSRGSHSVCLRQNIFSDLLLGVERYLFITAFSEQISVTRGNVLQSNFFTE